MQNVTEDEIALMDQILILTIEQDNWQKGTIAEQLKITEEEYQFLVDRIVDFNETHYKIVRVLDQGKPHQIIDKCFETHRFIKNGGFRKHWEDNHTKRSSKKPWYKTLWARATAAFILLAAVFGALNDGTTFLGRFWNKQSTHSETPEELILSTTPIIISTADLSLDVYKNDTVDIEITSGNFILLDSCFLKSIKYTDDHYLYRDDFSVVKPRIAVLNYFINKKILTKAQEKSRIVFTLDLDLIPNGSKVGWLDKNKRIKLAELTYQIFYKQNGIIKSKEVVNKIQLVHSQD